MSLRARGPREPTRARRRLRIPVARRPSCRDLGLPEHATLGSAGLDLRAAVDSEETIPPGGRARIPTGISIAIPPGFEGQIRPRSGLAIDRGVTVINAPGTIDSDFRGEVAVLLVNLGAEPFVVRRGDRVAQLVVAPVMRVEWEPFDAIPETVRQGGGFGSTGVE